MNQNEIDAFLAVIECGSISAAARRLYIGQPTLSARIQALETELGATLFSRSRGQRSTELTQAGQNFEPYARRWRQLWLSAQNAIHGTLQQPLAITAGHSQNAYLFPRIFQSLPDELQRLPIRLVQNHYYESFRLVEQGEADVGFVTNLQFSRTLNIFPVFQEEYVFLHGSGITAAPVIHPQSLPRQGEIYSAWDTKYNQWHNYWFGVPRNAAVETSDAVFLERVAVSGNYWAIVPRSVAASLSQTQDISYSLLEQGPPPRITSLICRQDIDDIPMLPQMLDIMKSLILEMQLEWLMV